MHCNLPCAPGVHWAPEKGGHPSGGQVSRQWFAFSDCTAMKYRCVDCVDETFTPTPQPHSSCTSRHSVNEPAMMHAPALSSAVRAIVCRSLQTLPVPASF